RGPRPRPGPGGQGADADPRGDAAHVRRGRRARLGQGGFLRRHARDRASHRPEALQVSGWIETARSWVNRWEIDPTDQCTVAFYFARLGDAAFVMLDRLGLAPSAAPTADVYVRYQRELRVGDIFHVVSGVIGIGDDSLTLGHKIFDSADDTRCTTV